MQAHFRPNQFLVLQFGQAELYIGYKILLQVQKDNPTREVETMLEAMHRYLFPAPRLVATLTHRLCEKCCCEIDLKKDRFQHRTDEKGCEHYYHLDCPMLKSPSERG